VYKPQATVLEMVNVLGRWEKTEQWRTRSEFSVVENERKPALAHTATKKRFEMAQRMGMAERVAMQAKQRQSKKEEREKTERKKDFTRPHVFPPYAPPHSSPYATLTRLLD